MSVWIDLIIQHCFSFSILYYKSFVSINSWFELEDLNLPLRNWYFSLYSDVILRTWGLNVNKHVQKLHLIDCCYYEVVVVNSSLLFNLLVMFIPVKENCEKPFMGEFSGSKWSYLLYSVYCKLHLHNWKSTPEHRPLESVLWSEQILILHSLFSHV